MRRRELIRELERAGCVLVQHDIYRNPATGQQQPVSRHDEIANDLARHIEKFPAVQE